MKKIIILGTGGFAREVLCLLDDLELYHQVAGFSEPDHIWQEKWEHVEIMGKPVIPYNELTDSFQLTIGIGNGTVREKIVDQLGNNVTYGTYIHPHATVSRWAEIGVGTIITAGCVITSQIQIGDYSQLNLNSTIGHDTIVKDYFTTAPSSNISGNCTIGKHVYFGTGAATKQGVSICDHVTVGMGAMVTKNIIESGIYVGIPAKKLQK